MHQNSNFVNTAGLGRKYEKSAWYKGLLLLPQKAMGNNLKLGEWRGAEFLYIFFCSYLVIVLWLWGKDWCDLPVLLYSLANLKCKMVKICHCFTTSYSIIYFSLRKSKNMVQYNRLRKKSPLFLLRLSTSSNQILTKFSTSIAYFARKHANIFYY